MTDVDRRPDAAMMPPRPAHVPAELVWPYPFASRGTTSTGLPRDLIPDVHKGPPVFWVDGSPHSNRAIKVADVPVGKLPWGVAIR